MLRYVWNFDNHIGHEWKEEKGKRVLRPTYNAKATAAWVEFVQDFKPDIVGFGGDQLNCGPVSHWRNVGENEMGRLQEEFEMFEDLVLGPAVLRRKHVRRIWHMGNHCVWLEDIVNKNPGLRGLVSIERELKLNERGFEVYSQGEVSKIGKCYFAHGDVIPGGINMARTAAMRYGHSIRFGHFHTYQVYTMHTPVSSDEIKSAMCVPCLANVAPQYGQNAPNNWANGWLYGEVDERTGMFWDHVVLWVGGKARVNGREY